MIEKGRGMIFPNSYDRDQFTPAQEAEMERAQAAAEAADFTDDFDPDELLNAMEGFDE